MGLQVENVIFFGSQRIILPYTEEAAFYRLNWHANPTAECAVFLVLWFENPGIWLLQIIAAELLFFWKEGEDISALLEEHSILHKLRRNIQDRVSTLLRLRPFTASLLMVRLPPCFWFSPRLRCRFAL